MALAVSTRADTDGGAAVWLDAHSGELAGQTAGGDLHEAGDADAELAHIAALTPRTLGGPQILVARQLDRSLQRQGVIAAVVGHAGERVEGEGVGGDEVAQADLDGIDAGFDGRLIDEPFEQGSGLGPASTAVCPCRRRVGDRSGDIEPDCGKCVGAVGHPLGARRQHRADVGVGTGIAHEAHPQPGEGAVVAHAEFRVLHLGPAVGQRGHVLAAPGRPCDRAAQTVGQGRHHGVLVVQAGFGAEASTDMRCDHTQPWRVPAERRRELHLHEVWHLRRAIHRHAAVVAGHRGARIGLERHRGDLLVDIAAPHDVGRAVERVDARRVGDLGCDVVGPLVEECRRPGGECRLGVGSCGQRVVVDPDELGSVDCLSHGLGHDDGDCFAHEADLAGRQRRASKFVCHLDEAVVRGDAELARGDHLDHSRRLLCFAGVDTAEARMGDGGTDEHRVAHALGCVVVDISAADRQQLRVFGSSDFVAQDRSSHGRRG